MQTHVEENYLKPTSLPDTGFINGRGEAALGWARLTLVPTLDVTANVTNVKRIL